MATAAEPQPASLPITGGRDQATVRLWPLLSATMKGPPGWFHRGDGRLATPRALGIGVPTDQWVDVPVVSFLVEHPGFGHFLIDTGFHSSVAVDPKQNLGRVGTLTFKDIRMEQSQAVSHQLRARGIEPASIKLVLLTHLHLDHASAISDYPAATFLLSSGRVGRRDRAARAAARIRDPPVRPCLRLPPARLRLSAVGVVRHLRPLATTSSATAACGWSSRRGTRWATHR